MWHTILAINSFIIAPILFVCLVYTTGLLVFTFQWKFFVIALILFLISIGAQFVLAILEDGH